MFKHPWKPHIMGIEIVSRTEWHISFANILFRATSDNRFWILGLFCAKISVYDVKNHLNWNNKLFYSIYFKGNQLDFFFTAYILN